MSSPNQAKAHRMDGGAHLGLTDVVRLLRRRRRVILTIAGLFTGLAALAVFTLPAQYTASTVLLVEGSDPKVLQGEAVVKTPPQDKALMTTHVQMILDRGFMGGIVDDLRLTDDPEFNAALPGGPRLADMAEDGLAWLAERLPPQVAFAKTLAADAATTAPERQRERTLGRLIIDAAQVEQTGEAYAIAVRISSFDPDKAALIANLVARRYVDGRLEARRRTTGDALAFLDARLGQLRTRASGSDTAVADYLRKEGLTQVRDDNPVLRQMDQLATQLILTDARRGQTEARLRQARALAEGAYEGRRSSALFDSPLLDELRRQSAGLEQRAAELSGTYGPRHPQVVNLKSEIAAASRRESDEVNRILDDIENQVLVVREEDRQLRARLAELEGRARRQQGATVALRDLERQSAADQVIYTELLTRHREVSEQLSVVGPGVSIVSAAQAPEIPSFPPKGLVIGGTFGGSLVLGVVAAFMAELLDTGLKSARQVQSALGLPALAMVPLVPRRRLKRRRPHHYLIDTPRSGFADALRSLRLELLQSNLDRPPQSVLVTSALPGEGKTTLATCLATIMAEQGLRTVIVDLDLHRPQLRGALRVPREVPGLVEHLAGECSLDAALADDLGVPCLSALTVRRTVANAGALVNTRLMADLVATLRGRFDFIVFDTPPTLAVSDARALAAFADTIVFVARWGVTRTDAARAGLERLGEGPTPIAGVVLNGVDVKRHAKGAYGDGVEYYRQYATYYRD